MSFLQAKLGFKQLKHLLPQLPENAFIALILILQRNNLTSKNFVCKVRDASPHAQN